MRRVENRLEPDTLGALELVVHAVADVDAARGLNAKSREQEQVAREPAAGFSNRNEV